MADAVQLEALQARNRELECELALHRDALEHMHQGLCMYDEDGTIILCNRRYGEILRLPEGSVHTGMTGLDVIRLGIAAGDFPADKTAEQIQAEIRAHFHSGSALPRPMVRGDHSYAIRRWTTPTGNMVATCEDITARLAAEEALRESEARLSAMLGAMPDCVKIFDQAGQLIYINPNGLELLQAPDLATLTASGHSPLPPEHLPEAIAVHGRVMAGESVVWHYDVIGMQGRRRSVEAHAVPFQLPDGTPAHLSITRDVTERKEADDALRHSEKRLRLVQETASLGDFEMGPGFVSHISDRFIEQTGLPAGTRTLTHDQWMTIIHPDDRAELERHIADSRKVHDTVECEFRIIRPDNGDVRWIYSRTRVERDVHGNSGRGIGAHLDITERKRADEALRESEERFRLASEAAGFGVWDFDVASATRQWSGRLREIFGIAQGAPATLETVEACVHRDDRGKFRRQLDELLAGPTFARFETSLRIRRASDHELRWIALHGWKTVKAISGSPRIILTVRDITAEKTVEERVRWTADHDQLTGLANRAQFQHRLDQATQVAAARGTSFGMLLLDMDDFKQINDTLGHDAGDELLRRFAERLRGAVRKEDTVARFGGDEFAIIMPQLDSADLLTAMSNSILDRLREPFVHDGRLLDCRVSMGATMFPNHGATSEALLKSADLALYAAKSGGRGMLRFFEPKMRQDLQRRSSMVQLARDALRHNRVYAYYQPKLDLATGALDGFEALLRWRRPGGRVEHPASLEAAFEDLEVAAAISDRMIELTIADMRRWLDRGIDFGHIAVNASAAEFRRDNFAERLLDSLLQADIAAHRFQLEVTETVFLGRGAEYVHRALSLLSVNGVKIALDDFGTGYASLRHLKEFPVDIIKIDRSFVRDMDSDPGDEAIVRAVVNLGKSLGIKVVAEGIEKRWQAERLVAMECDFGQGYLFSRAAPARQVPALVARLTATDVAFPRRAAAARLRLVAGGI
ncbi:MAG: EAL domain-containing protein [Croceibacterium sp.]